MKFLSVCSGIEAAGVLWRLTRLGNIGHWATRWQCPSLDGLAKD
jgi:hypothetical protein